MNDCQKPILTIHENIQKDTLEYRNHVERFVKGQTSPITFRAYRVPMGVYEQRIPARYMIRIRIPAGMVFPYQLERVAQLSKQYGSGFVHVTTRQDLQIHDVSIEDTTNVLEGLLEAGLTSRGGGGNTVRNVTVCPRTGVCPYEVFDVSGSSVAVSEYLLQDRSSFNLPRKFKIAFSGCSRDCAFASVADLGFFAHTKNGTGGFSVYAAGGLGSNPRVGIKIEDFIDDNGIFEVIETVKRLFDKHGDRSNKYRARLRYVLMKVGAREFINLYENERKRIYNEGLPYAIPEIRDVRSRFRLVSESDESSSSRSKKDLPRNVMIEKTAGMFTVRLRVNLGNIPADDLIEVGQIAQNFGEGIVRATQLQDLLICGVPGEKIDRVISSLRKLSIDVCENEGPKIVTCTGSATCKLGLCLSRGLAQVIAEQISGGQKLSSKLNDWVIRISGCPNSCGHHYIGDLGFEGRAKRINGKLMPFYDVLYGAKIAEGEARLAEKIGAVPAKKIPHFVAELFASHPTITGKLVKDLIARYNELPLEQLPPDYYYDCGAAEPFSLAGRGPGECGAGVMDVIKLDIDDAKQAVKKAEEAQSLAEKNNALYAALVSAARALLVTFGLEPKKDREVFGAFTEYLIDPGWVDPQSRELLNAAMDWRMGDRDTIDDFTGKVGAIINRVEELFYSLDANLKFQLEPVEKKTNNIEKPPKRRLINLRGVACPLNFVRAKLELEKIGIGEVLDILLDDGEPVRNVPASFQEQGQEVIEVKRSGDHFHVMVRRRE